MVLEYLINLDFIEVETPILNQIAGGLQARPFKTHHNELKLDMFMRIVTRIVFENVSCWWHGTSI